MPKKDILDLILTSVVLGVGLASGHSIITASLGGIGVNWASEIVWAAWEQVRDKWFGTNGLLHDDVAHALDQALNRTLAPVKLADEFKAIREYKALSRFEARAALKALSALERKLTSPFSTGQLS